MKLVRMFLASLVFVSATAYSQQADTLAKTIDSLPVNTDSLGVKKNDISTVAYEGVKIDLKTYFMLLGDDLKQQATMPLHTKGKNWVKAGGFALLTGAVSLANKPINRFAVNLYDNNRGVAAISKYITRFGGAYELYTLAGFFTSGLIFKTQKEKTTTILATQAYITAGVIQCFGKFFFAAQRPYYTDPLSNRKGAIFRGPFYAFKKTSDGQALSRSDYSSFPSGHTTAAFAAATVYAMEYRDKPLIPVLSYSAATLIGLSRLTENKHWPVDILVGGMLGYISGRQVVNNYHRFSKSRQAGKPAPKTVSFNFQYANSQLIPGLVYNF